MGNSASRRPAVIPGALPDETHCHPYPKLACNVTCRGPLQDRPALRLPPDVFRLGQKAGRSAAFVALMFLVPRWASFGQAALPPSVGLASGQTDGDGDLRRWQDGCRVRKELCVATTSCFSLKSTHLCVQSISLKSIFGNLATSQF